MADKGWHRVFDNPIPLPGGGELRTLRDAANYISKLPKAEHDAPEWQAAVQALMIVAEHDGQNTARADRGSVSCAALHRHHAPEPTPRKKRVKKHGGHPMTRAWIAALRRRDALGALGCSVGPVTFRFHVRRRQTHVNVRRGFINVVLEIGGFLNEPSPQMRIRDRFGEI
jgi:hypothetical protein